MAKYLKINLPVSFKMGDNTYIDLINNKILINVKEVEEDKWDEVYISECEHMHNIKRKPTREEILSYKYDEGEEVEETILKYGGYFDYDKGFENFMCPICHSEYYKELDITTTEITGVEFSKMNNFIHRTYYGQIDDYNPDPYDDFAPEWVCCKELEDKETNDYKILWHQFYGSNDTTEIKHQKNMSIEKIFYYNDCIVLKYSDSKKKFIDMDLKDKIKYVTNLLNENKENILVLNNDNDPFKPLTIEDIRYIVDDNGFYLNKIGNFIKGKKITNIELDVSEGFIWDIKFYLENNEVECCYFGCLNKSRNKLSYRY